MPLFNTDGGLSLVDQSLADQYGLTSEEYLDWKNNYSGKNVPLSGYAQGDLTPTPEKTDREKIMEAAQKDADAGGDIGRTLLDENASGFTTDALGNRTGTTFVDAITDNTPRPLIEETNPTLTPVGGPPLTAQSDLSGGTQIDVPTPEPLKQFGDYADDKFDQFGNYIGERFDQLGDYINNMTTSGDATSEMFGKIWPYKQAQLDEAQRLFGSDDTLNPAFSQSTQDYLTGTRARALGGDPTLQRAEQELGGLFGGVDPSAGFYGDVAAGRVGQANPMLQGYDQLAGRVGQNPLSKFYQGTDVGANRAFNELGRTSRGEYLQDNPYLDKIYERGAGKLTEGFEDAMNRINSSFNLQGGFGSSARGDALGERAGELTESLGGLYSDIYGGNYQRERDRQLQATGQLGGLSDTAMGRMMSGAGQLGSQYNVETDLLGDISRGRGDIYEQGLNRRMQGAGALSGAYGQDFQRSLSAIDPAFRFADQDYTDLGQLGQAGGVQDIQNKSLAMEPWQKVGLFGDAIGGVPSGQSAQQGGNPLMGALGGAATGSAFGPWGAVGGGLLGFFGSR